MKKLYFANTNFEFELSEEMNIPLKQSLEKHPVCLQLQFLPLLFADPNDEVLVTDMPDFEYLSDLEKLRGELPKIVLDSRDTEMHSWGWSKNLQEWTKKRGIIYNMPSWEIVRQINSKEWSFRNSPKLEGAALIFSQPELEDWIKRNQGHSVLKSCFGLSGRGNVLINEINPKVLAFCKKEWAKKLPVIAEPWVERTLDFSTQWLIGPDSINYLGATKLINSTSGSYLGTMTGGEKLIPEVYLSEHMSNAKELLLMAQQMGFKGYAGVDAMVYKKGQETLLQPIVEVNARMTMALAAILIQQKVFLNQSVFFEYVKIKAGLLPIYLQTSNKVIRFSKQLQVTSIA